MASTDYLTAALELVPEAWLLGVTADAAAQGATVGFTAAAGGLRTDVIDRIHAVCAARAGDPEREALSEGQRLDALFPNHRGIGAFDLLDELGIAPVYVLTTSC
ncbi:hypothetical protein [Gordonia alkaliphila]|uniref:Uncharacterized protein n=1 Tax=Gordonia alkaliphila TaxID=1053547 RepID=A0ABP8Z0A7_9ACTN